MKQDCWLNKPNLAFSITMFLNLWYSPEVACFRWYSGSSASLVFVSFRDNFLKVFVLFSIMVSPILDWAQPKFYERFDLLVLNIFLHGVKSLRTSIL